METSVRNRKNCQLNIGFENLEIYVSIYTVSKLSPYFIAFSPSSTKSLKHSIMISRSNYLPDFSLMNNWPKNTVSWVP